MPDHPPRLAERLLRLVLGSDDAEAIGGDLDESFRAAAPRIGKYAARRWYWRQALSIAMATFRERIPEPSNNRARGGVMAGLKQDVAYALRSLRRQPGFTAMAVVMLAVGIGGTLAMFSLAYAVLYKPLPFAHPDRLAMVHLMAPTRESPAVIRKMVWSWPKYRMLRDEQRVFDSMALLSGTSWNVTGLSGPERINGEVVEASYFDVLGVTAHIGRTFSVEETRTPGSNALLLLGHGLWVRSFGGDPSVVGRVLRLNGVPHTVVGVLPPGFRGITGQAEMWEPMVPGGDDYDQPWSHSYPVIARRKADVSPQEADAAVRVIGTRIDRQYADTFVKAAWSASSVPLDEERADEVIRRSILLLLGAVAAVLLIVCINLANLMLARGLAREREVAIRLALGASRLRVVRQLMTESALLAVAGAALGLVIGYVVISAGATLMPDLRLIVPRGSTSVGLTRVGLNLLGLDPTVLLFALLIAASAALLFGLGPAWRTSGRGLSASMKAGGTGSVSPGTRGVRLRNVLIVGEMAVALVLLTGAGLMLKSVARIQAIELGFKPASLLSFRVALPSPQYNAARGTQFFDALLERLAQRADVESVAFGNCAPASTRCNITMATFPDRPPAARGTEPLTGVLWASPRLFETLGARLVRGRAFTPQDRIGQPKVVVVNEAAARQFWDGEDPIGRRIGVGQGGFLEGAEVVGVVADVRYGAMEGSIEPDVYLPVLQSGRTSGLIFVRSRVSTQSIVPAIRQAVQALDPNLPITDVKLMDERFAEATWRPRMSAWVLGSFAALAMLLAALGIYSVMSQGVEQRTREIGVRLALGADRSHIMRLIVGRVLAIAAAGIALGVLLAVPSMRLLTALLYQVKPGDPLVFAGLSCLLLAVAVLAGYVPARRATRVDPLNTLRAE